MESPIRPFPKSSGAPDLKAAMRAARIEESERSAVSADLRFAELSRLEMLQELLAPVFAQIPREAELFDLGLVPGERPRLFIDMVAFVEMARDRRAFRFLQDTRAGRNLLLESDKIEDMAEAVTAYLGRRLVEREKALADAFDQRPVPADASGPRADPVRDPRYSFADTLFAFVMGMLAGASLLFAFGWLSARGALPPLP